MKNFWNTIKSNTVARHVALSAITLIFLAPVLTPIGNAMPALTLNVFAWIRDLVFATAATADLGTTFLKALTLFFSVAVSLLVNGFISFRPKRAQRLDQEKHETKIESVEQAEEQLKKLRMNWRGRRSCRRGHGIFRSL